jgi:predicted DNA-binding protein
LSLSTRNQLRFEPERLAPSVTAKVQWGYSITVFSEYEAMMTLTVRLDAALETKVDQEAKRLGVTKSEFVKDALERILGLKDPAALLKAVRSRRPMGNPNASQNVSATMKAKLREKRSA